MNFKEKIKAELSRKNTKKKEKILKCDNCKNVLDKVLISDMDMEKKLRKLVEIKSKTIQYWGLKLDDFDNPKKVKKVMNIAHIFNCSYDYFKCSKCGWGMLEKKPKDEIRKNLLGGVELSKDDEKVCDGFMVNINSKEDKK